VEAKTMQTNVGEENVVEVEVRPSIEVQVMAEAQRRVIEMERCESKVLVKKKHTILYRVTLLEKGIKISNLD
jgi:DNA-directed RNA polymerase subunit RPC12/RpoP